ncbi:RHS repeat-associated core domain-containing protein [Sorangium sp. So ce513]|uniref:RHS repeat-associated core domain-containing protein n=1 Tax=Sorangium sp. So ce513 TaxID=3133315 RepID=UPI003F6360D6
MARTAPVPNIPAIPGMNPGVFILGGGGGGGGGSGRSGGGGAGKQGAGGGNGGSSASGGGKSALSSCGSPGQDGGGCPNHHGGRNSGKVAQGDPVDVFTGRVFTLRETDLHLPGPLEFEFARGYSSAARDRDRGLGFGWTHTFSWEIELRSRRCLVATPEGTEIELGPIPSDAAVIGADGWLLHREGHELVLNAPDGIRRRFERDPTDALERRLRLALVQDRHGNRIALQWERGRLAALVDSVGRLVSLQSGERGQIAAIEVITASRQRYAFARYTYDDAGRLVAATDADGHTTRYAYDDRNLLRAQEAPTGVTFFYRYDDAARCVETWGEVPGGEQTILAASVPEVLHDGTRARGIHHYRFLYGDDGYTEVIDPVTSHRYTGTVHGKAENAVLGGRVFTRTYDDCGYLRSFTDPEGATTRWERDLLGFETRIVDPLGRETLIERLPGGDIRRITDPEGGVTEVSYGPGSIMWIDPLGASFEVRHDARGLVQETVAPDGHRTRYRYDRDGNLIEVAGEQGARFHATYDELGRRTSMTDAKGAVTRFTWSPAGRLLGVTAPDGTAEWARYDGRGALIAMTDAQGRTIELRRGGTGVLTEAILPDGRAVTLRYDRLERLVEIRNARGEVYTIVYDALGLPVLERTFDGRELRSSYDACGRLMAVESGPGTRVEVERDLAGQVIKRIDADGREERFEYNRRGELVLAESDVGTFTFERNAAGWVTREVQTAFGRSIEIRTKYDLLGAVVERATSLGHAMTWRRDRVARRAEIELDGGERVTLHYGATGLEVERWFGGGARVESRYDALDRLVGRRLLADGARRAVRPGEPEWVGPRDPGVLLDQRWAYTPAGELASTWDAELGATRFGYDALGQLLAAVPEHAQQALFGYDDTGNLFEVGEAVAARRYDGDRLILRGDARYRYDAQGRLVEERAPGPGGSEQVTRYTWSPRGLLLEVRRPDGTAVRFAYDPLSRRIQKALWRQAPDGRLVLAEAVRFVWDGTVLVHEIRHAGEAVQQRTYVFDGDGAPLAHRDVSPEQDGERAGAWVHYLNDLTGSPERLVRGDGRVVATLRRTPWGQAAPARPSEATTPLRLLGQYADEETGLHYNWHRYYDPAAGRYISPDPLEIEGGLNPFRYALNRPTSLVDPEGLIYSRIVDRSGKVLYDGRNPGDGGNVNPPAHISDKPCAEAQALTQMSSDIRAQVVAEQKRTPVEKRLNPQQIDQEVNARIKKTFQEQELSIETFESKYDADRNQGRVDPCERCGAMFRALGITDAVVGAKGKRGEFGVYSKGGGGKKRRGR